MNNINYNLVTFIAAVTVMTSCKEEDLALISQDKKVHSLMIKVREDAAASSSRTAITGRLFTWATEDSLGLYTAITNNKGAFKLIGGQGTNKGTFSGNLTAVDELVYAAYPHADASTFNATTYTSNFVMSQAQKHLANGALDSTSIGEYALMFGQSNENVSTDITSTTDVNISMKHLTAIIDFQVSDIPPNTVIRELTLKASHAIFPSKVEVDLSTGVSILSDERDNIKVALFNSDGDVGVNVGERTSLTIRLNMLPTSVPANDSLIVSLTMGDANNTVIKSSTKNITEGKTYEAGGLYDAPLNYDTDFLLTTPGEGSGGARPNIIFFLMDDLGYGDVGCFGQTVIETPNIDRLADEGKMFTQHYAGQAVSAPSRCVLMTGLHTGHAEIRANDEMGNRDFATGNVKSFQAMWDNPLLEGNRPMSADTRTLAHLLQGAGYETACVGKWGMGYPGSTSEPNKMGFDYFFGSVCQRQCHTFYPTHLYENTERVVLRNFVDGVYGVAPKKGGSLPNGLDKLDVESYAMYQKIDYSPDTMHVATMNWLEKNKSNPFFLWWTTTLPHVSLQAPQRWIDYYRNKFGNVAESPLASGGPYYPCRYPKSTYAAMISYADEQIGEIIEKLKADGNYDNTLIVFSSDNGPATNGGASLKYFGSNGGLTGAKADLTEGGIRVPTIVKWTGTVEPGSSSDYISCFYDWLPTFADIIGTPLTQETDGLSILPAMRGDAMEERDFLYWEYKTSNVVAVRAGDWKLIVSTKNGNKYLYNLTTNGGKETANVAAANPKKVTELMKIVWREHTKPVHSVFDITGFWNRTDGYWDAYK